MKTPDVVDYFPVSACLLAGNILDVLFSRNRLQTRYQWGKDPAALDPNHPVFVATHAMTYYLSGIRAKPDIDDQYHELIITLARTAAAITLHRCELPFTPWFAPPDYRQAAYSFEWCDTGGHDHVRTIHPASD